MVTVSANVHSFTFQTETNRASLITCLLGHPGEYKLHDAYGHQRVKSNSFVSSNQYF